MQSHSPDSRDGSREAIAAVSKQCPGLQQSQPSEPATRDDLFVEAVILEVPSDPRDVSITNLQDLPQTTPVQLVATPHVLGPYNHQTEMLLVSGDIPADRLSLVRWAALPRRADGAVVLELELELDRPGSGSVSNTSRIIQKFAATVHHNVPTLARIQWDEVSRRSLVVLLRTFEVRGEADLRAIFQCKMQQRTHSMR